MMKRGKIRLFFTPFVRYSFTECSLTPVIIPVWWRHKQHPGQYPEKYPNFHFQAVQEYGYGSLALSCQSFFCRWPRDMVLELYVRNRFNPDKSVLSLTFGQKKGRFLRTNCMFLTTILSDCIRIFIDNLMTRCPALANLVYKSRSINL